jgi:hypothetical protein
VIEREKVIVLRKDPETLRRLLESETDAPDATTRKG